MPLTFRYVRDGSAYDRRMGSETDPRQLRWWSGLIVFLLILSGAIWFALEQYATTVPDENPPTIPYAIRKEVRVGPDYLVAVTTVNLNANEAIARADASNPPPKGQYVIATLTTAYAGDKAGNPAKDLVVTYRGADTHVYSTSTCHADIGVTASGQHSVCFDLPPDVISGGNVGVALRSSPQDLRYWEINN
jgi:hypothetical protein